MIRTFAFATVIILLCRITCASAQHVHDDTSHRLLDRESAPHEHFAGHPEAHLSHPMITESPLPENKFRFNYLFAKGEGERSHNLAAELEYAFVPWFSAEVIVPYTFIDFDDNGNTRGLDNVEVAFKFASFAFLDQGILPALGLAVVIPTGDDADGIGSDHIWELEPFFRIGHWCGPWEFIGAFAASIPLNQDRNAGEDDDFALLYNISTVYNVSDSFRAILEFHGETVFGSSDQTALYVSPGIAFQPFADKHWNFGLGVTLPLTNTHDADYTINFMTILHF